MSLPFDATVKEILAPEPEEFVPAFGLPTTKPAMRLNIDLSTLSAATDVAIGFGEPLQEIADLNFQSGPDPDVDRRCHLYNAAWSFRFGVPVRSILILLRPKADSSAITGNLTYASGGSRVEFQYEVVRMWQQSPQPYLKGGVHLLPLAPLCQMPADQPLVDSLRAIIREIDRRLGQECERAEAAKLMTAAFVLTGMRIHRDNMASLFDGVKIMHESSAFDLMVEEGEIRGIQKFLLRQGTRRLGPPPEEVLDGLKAINDIDRLHRMGDALWDATAWTELLETP